MEILRANKKIIKLSSTVSLYKSDTFIKQTQGIAHVDLLLNLITNAIIERVVKNKIKNNETIIVSSIDEENKFFIKILNIKDIKGIVFYKYFGKEKKGRKQDRRFFKYTSVDGVDFVVNKTTDDTNEFNKLYIITNSDDVNMPLLNKEQERIVTMEDNNILVQGVAGSGKTNICIDKIVYAACRHYLGKTLYSTYSHALLLDTKKKIEKLNKNIREFIENYNKGNILFLDNNKIKAIKNYLGVLLDINNEDFISELEAISQYLYQKVDYKLIEDFALNKEKKIIREENYFYNSYIKNIKNYNLLSNIEKIKYLSFEIIYKEIFGIIFGSYYNNSPTQIIPKEEYIKLRESCFSRQEANTIYLIALDYYDHLHKNNLMDNNIISRELLEKTDFINKYSLVVLDEVQDFTQLNLNFFKRITIKLFAVGDVLQMINPTYFSFAYLKRLMFDQNISSVVELKNNYRNSKKIERLIDSLSKLNIEHFGVHNFVIRGQSVDSELFSNAVYVNDGNFLNHLNKDIFYEFTIVVSSSKKKEELLKLMPKQEILTVSEIKGLERNSVVLYDILSDSADKWAALNRNVINKKKAEENSIYRYYFNLLYVGLSRAKQNLFVIERKNIDIFKNYFKDGFENKSAKAAAELLLKTVNKIEVDENEIFKRIDEFIKLEQFENARFNAKKLPDEDDMNLQLKRIEIYEKYVRANEFRKAGIELWKIGLFEDAKNLFILSHDEKLIELIETSQNKNSQKLEYDIVQFFDDVKESKEATDLIIETLKNDISNIREAQQQINKNIKKMKNR